MGTESVYMLLCVNFSCEFSKLIICTLDTMLYHLIEIVNIYIYFFLLQLFLNTLNVKYYSNDKQRQKKQIIKHVIWNRLRKNFHFKYIVDFRVISSENFSLSWNIVLRFFQKILKKTDRTHPFPTCLHHMWTALERFYDFFGLKGMAIVLGCDGCASGRVCY